MKPKYLVLGLFLVFFGGLFWMDNIYPLNLDWDLISRLWPVLLILLGITALSVRSDIKSILFSLTAILLALLVFSSVKHNQFSVKEFFRSESNAPSNDI
jgi:hypothetical protein